MPFVVRDTQGAVFAAPDTRRRVGLALCRWHQVNGHTDPVVEEWRDGWKVWHEATTEAVYADAMRDHQCCGGTESKLCVYCGSPTRAPRFPDPNLEAV